MEYFAQIIEQWYDRNGRNLPWRNTSDAYRIWISEIILQQTRVVQGYDYFLRFMEYFPTVKALAAVTEDEVMKLWQGLGYYSRARNLYAAARYVVEVYGGKFPENYDDVRALKGVGDYTAAAICSFAYNQPYAVVDGNVFRVLSRWMGVDVPIDSAKGKKQFAILAENLLDRQNPSLYNQAIMDFGALQCVPQSPDCGVCPLRDTCVACREGRVDAFPVKAHKTKTVTRYLNYIYVRAGAFTFINKRTGNDIWKNLWEFPLIETEYSLAEEEFYTSDLFRRLIVNSEEPTCRCLQKNVKHVLSHRILNVTFYEVSLPADTQSFVGFTNIETNSLEEYAVPRLIHRFMEQFVFPVSENKF